jgi:hypothetical protein
MCHALGIHIDTDRFNDWTNYNRRAIYAKALEFNLYTYSVFKAFYKIEFQFQFQFDSQLYDTSWQLLPKLVLDRLKLSDDEAKLISITTVLSNKFLDQCIHHMIFSQPLPKSDDEIENICLHKYYTLKKIYSSICKEFETLRINFTHCLYTVELSHDLLTVTYACVGLAILEFGRRSMASINQKFIYKSIELCFKTLSTAYDVKFNQHRVYSYYYASISLITLIKYTDQYQKQEMKAIFKILKTKFLHILKNESILPYLIFNYGEKKVI